jgi:hypothetical protein
MGKPDWSNGAFGKSDIEGKTAREAASELGKEQVSNGRERMSQFQRDQDRPNENEMLDAVLAKQRASIFFSSGIPRY